MTGLSTTAGASDQNVINATRKPAILKDARRGELAVDDEAQHHGQHTLRQGRADCHSQEEDNRKNQNAHALFIGGAARRPVLLMGIFRKRRGVSQGETRVQTPCPAWMSTPALTSRSTMREAASGDTCSESLSPSIVTNGAPPWTISSRTVRTTSARRVVSRRFSSTTPRYPRGAGDWRLGDGRPGLIAIRHDPIEQVRQTQGKQIDGFVHHLRARKRESPLSLSARGAVTIGVKPFPAEPVDIALGAVADCLTAVASSAGLLSQRLGADADGGRRPGPCRSGPRALPITLPRRSTLRR